MKKKKVNSLDIDLDLAYVQVNTKNSKRPVDMSLGDIIKLSDNKLPKDAIKIPKMYISADDNYLYIWVKDKWKRIPLSEF
ncbi:hypothetical protein M0Q50_08560 [bacterium]|jgi:hypothetical protein|nr:hypothetical protein [bacterium]